MIRVKFRFGTANRKEMSWMSETPALMDTLRQEGVSPDLLRAVEEYRTAHPLAEALRPRIPSPAFVYYGREVWEQALAALLCGENLLLAGGKATGKNVLAENLAAAFGRPAWDISFHVNMDAASLIGMDTFEGGQVKFRPARSTAAPRAAASVFWTRSTWRKMRRWPSCTRCWISAAPSMCRATSASRWPRRPASSPP